MEVKQPRLLYFRRFHQSGNSVLSRSILGTCLRYDLWMLSGLTLMPVTGNVNTAGGENVWRSEFSHDSEIVQPGYHRLFLDDYNIWVEQTATDRSGMYRLTFCDDAPASILVNLGGYLSTTTMTNAHVFAHAGKPWLTQYWVRRVQRQAYSGTSPDWGYGGHDEDQGQMGALSALMAMGIFCIDGWDAPWSRLYYDDISFQEIYNFCKSIQPECLIMDLNGAKYPAEALFYSDLKTYEQGAGRHWTGAFILNCRAQGYLHKIHRIVKKFSYLWTDALHVRYR